MKDGRKTVIAFFGGLIKKQEQWLNKKVSQGWRLVKSGIMTYTFERCEPGAYQYAVDYVGSKSNEDATNYHDFLEGMGYRVFYKNINATYSLFHVRFRMFKKNPWIPATTLTNYNKELLIVERKAEEGEFKLHTSGEDIKNYYMELLSPYCFLAIMAIGMGIVLQNIWCALIGLVFIVPAAIYISEIVKVKKLEKTEEL